MNEEKTAKTLPPDKRAHALMGAAIALLTVSVGFWIIPGFFWPGQSLKAAALGAGMAWVAGLGKEIFDWLRRRKGRFFDSVDWWFTALGGIGGGLLTALAALFVRTDPGTAVAVSGVLLALGLLIGGAVLRRRGL